MGPQGGERRRGDQAPAAGRGCAGRSVPSWPAVGKPRQGRPTGLLLGTKMTPGHHLEPTGPAIRKALCPRPRAFSADLATQVVLQIKPSSPSSFKFKPNSSTSQMCPFIASASLSTKVLASSQQCGVDLVGGAPRSLHSAYCLCSSPATPGCRGACAVLSSVLPPRKQAKQPQGRDAHAAFSPQWPLRHGGTQPAAHVQDASR